MKKTYIFILSIFIGFSSINAQSTCIDTVFYPESKRTDFGGYQLISETGNSLAGFSQTYNSNTGLVHGVDAYVLLDTNGIIDPLLSKDVYVKVFNVDALNRPVGAAIDSNLVTLTDVGTARQTLMFASPVAVSGKYAVSITLNPLTSVANNDSIWFRGNDDSAIPADGLNEGLLGLNLVSPGFGWTNFFLQFGTADYDALIAPIFEKTITASYTTDVDTVCLGDTVQFTNTSTLSTNYMYNRWDSLNTELWMWNYGDGTGTYNHFDTTYTFATAGANNTELIITNYGYTSNCVDTMKKQIVVNDTAIADFTFSHSGGGVYQFNNTSTDANTYSWDFGDGYSASLESPSHTYTSTSNYTVCLTVTDSNGCNIDSICKAISFVLSVDDFDAADYVNVYPVPANKYINVTVPSNYYGSEIVITDVVGQKINSVQIENQNKVRIPIGEIETGIYFISINHDGEQVFTKRIAVNK